jgi:hypothetical protein
MSVVEDVRKVFQDLLAPDLKAIDARIKGLEDVMKARFDAVDSRFEGVETRIKGVEEVMKARFDAVEEIAAARHSALLAVLEKDRAQTASQLAALIHALDIEKRLTKLESRQNLPSAHSLTDVA